MKKITLSGSKIKAVLIIVCFIIGAAMILLGSGESDDNKIKSDKKGNDEITYSEIIENKLESFLKTVDGIESVKAFVTVDGGKELEYAGIGKSDGYTSDYLTINNGNGEEAAVIREIYPGIRGVAITCTGGGNANIKNEITSLISAALGISTNKIMVTGYK